MRSSLSKHQAATPMTEDELLIKKAQAWRDKVALVVTFEQMAQLNNREYENCINIGKKLYDQGIE